MPPSAPCLFCGIVSRSIPAAIVAENDYALAFLDVHPVARGHVVVIPKEHTPQLADLADDHTGPLFTLVRDSASAVTAVCGADATTIGINNGSAAGQAIHHLHIHVIPRFANDGGMSLHGIVPHDSSLTADATLVEKIKNHFRSLL